MLPQLVDDRFQVFSLPLPGYFSPFPYGTSSLSVVGEYLALEDGPPRFPRGFTCPAVLRYGLSCCSVSDTGLSPSMECLPSAFLLPTHRSIIAALQPQMIKTIWFRLIPFRSPLLWESRLISSPAGTEMFHFPAFAPMPLFYSEQGDMLRACRVSPFRHPRVKGY